MVHISALRSGGGAVRTLTMSSISPVDPGHLLTYTVIYPIIIGLGLFFNTIGILVLRRPALAALQVKM